MKNIITFLTLIAFTVYSSYAGSYGDAKSVLIYYADADTDGYGDASSTTNASSQPPGYVSNDDDCDDTKSWVHPGATEVCNGIDDNCDGSIDEGVLSTFYVDYDGDAYYNSHVIILSCTAPMGWGDVGSYPGSDFDETDGNSTGGWEILELCNGMDDDGDGLIDDNDPDLAQLMIPWYADADGDGYGDPDNLVMACCSHPVGYLPWPNNGDCDDTDPSIKPGAQELCNGIDDNCDGVIDMEICNSMDTDCDGVPDNFDVCPGGDDSVDYNGDNIPDCSQLLNYNQYSLDWRCANNKIYVCHNDNNPHTICIDANALLPAHYNHGDKIGPCTSCGQDLILPGNNGSSTDIDEPQELEVFPNPATDQIELHYAGEINEIRLISAQGLQMHAFETDADPRQIRLEKIPAGLYLLMIRSDRSWVTKKFIKL